jgi:mannose-6-phosphate isomerase-like protein (cupin superfamily)
VNRLRAIDATTLPWTPHRTFPGVHVRSVQDPETSAQLEVRWLRIAPSGQIPSHAHEHSSETFYVLAGEGAFDLEGTLTPCHAGCCGFAGPGATHGIRNTGQGDLELLAIFTPPLSQ